MANKDEKVNDMNEQEVENMTDDLKATDFVEPKGKFRKIIKWVLGGLALVATGVAGALIGKNIGSGNDDDNQDDSKDTSEPANE